MEYTLTREHRDSWSGIVAYGDCNTKIVPEIDRRNQVVTGLSTKEARDLEQENGMTAGTLAPNSPYWYEEFLIPFNGILKLDDQNPDDKIKLAVLKAMKKVAVGRDELKKKSKAIYLLSSKALETKNSSKIFDVKEKAWKLFINATDTTLKQTAVVLEKGKAKGRILDVSSMDIEAVKNKLRGEIESNAVQFITIIEDEDLNLKFEVVELVTNRILSFNSSGYFYKSDLLAPDLDGMAQFLKDPHNQPRVIQFKQELKTKTGKK